MDTITLKVKTTKPTQEIELRFSETRSSKPIQFKIDWGDGTLNTQTSHVYKMPANQNTIYQISNETAN